MPKHRERPVHVSRAGVLGRAALVLAAVLTAVAALVGAPGEPATASANLVVNPDFETDTRGWYAKPGTALGRDVGRTGRWSGKITNTSQYARTSVLNDQVNTVTSTKKGVTYTASAWVRTDAPGTSVAIRTMEYAGSQLFGQRHGHVWLRDTNWQRVTVTYSAGTDGATIDLNVLAWGLRPQSSFNIDDVVLTSDGVGSDAPATTSPTAPPTQSSMTSPPAPPPTSLPVTTPSSPPVAPTTPIPPPPPAASPPPAPAPAGWRLAWSDEFSGSGLDRAKWNAEHYSTYGDGNLELPCLMDRPENLFVSNGALTLRALREASPIQCGSRDSRFPQGREYTAAHITSRGKAAFQYGRFEIRAKLPMAPNVSKGLWPAFWLRPDNGSIGELDILEAVGSSAGGSEWSKISHTLWYDYVRTHPMQNRQTTLTTPSEWHTYAAEWQPGEIRWLIDGNVVWSRDSSTTPWLNEAFDRPFYIRLNLAVGGRWPGSPDAATQFPADYQIDYVRVYQR